MKKALALILALTMLLALLAGCGGPSDTPTPAETPSGAQDGAADAAEPSASDDADTAGEPQDTAAAAYEDVPPTALPITTEPVTFSCWISDAALANEKTGMQNLSENAVMQKLEELTGVHWEFEMAASGSLSEKFNLMLISGSWPDLISAMPALFTGGYDKYIEDEIIIDIKALAEEYAPHYWALINEDETVLRELLTDSGYMSGFQQLYPSVQPNWAGFFVRQDWVDASGVGQMETYEDWDSFLAWVKANTDSTGLFLNSTTGQQGIIMAGLNASTGMLQENNQLYFRPITDEYKNYLALIAGWYAKGYVDKDFASNNAFAQMGNFTSGDYGIFWHMYTYRDLLENMGRESNPDFTVAAIQAPVQNRGDKILVNPGMLDSRLGGQRASISATCENPELLVQWYDYLYSEEGAFLCNYGIEGEAYNIVDGEIVLTDALVNNPNGWAYSEVMNLYIMPSYFPYYFDWGREALSGISDAAQECCYVWFDCWDIPNQKSISSYVSLTSEESESISSRYTDINTLVQEFTSKVIIGEESLDNWDSFVANIKSMGIDEIVATYQDAYDRYLAR